MEPTRPEAYVLGLRLARELKDYDAVPGPRPACCGPPGPRTTSNCIAKRKTPPSMPSGPQAEAGTDGRRRAPRGDGAGPHARPLRAAAMGRRRRSRFVGRRAARDTTSCDRPAIARWRSAPARRLRTRSENCYEEYICARAPGVYVVRVRRIDGNIVGKRAQLTVVLNQGGQNESSQTFVLKLERAICGRSAFRCRTVDGDNSAPIGRRRRPGPANCGGSCSCCRRDPRPRQIPWRCGFLAAHCAAAP